MEYAEQIRAIVAKETPRLRRIGDTEAASPRAPGKWSRKEVIGHLIDSAGNNLQRIVRAWIAGSLEFPGYAQNEWVQCQDYRAEGWTFLVELWSALNRHLAHVVERIPAEELGARVSIGDNPAVTLDAMVADYLRHLAHHLEQVQGA